jgi:hypothetical protein
MLSLKKFAALALVISVTNACWAAEASVAAPDKTVALDAVPALVKDAITAKLDGGKVKKITQSESDGKAIFIVQLEKKDGTSDKKVFCDEGIELHEVSEDAKNAKEKTAK